MRLAGQTALVTGASRGLGRAIALRLARDGASVCVNYFAQISHADSLVEEIRAAGGQAIAIQADVGDPAQAQGMVERAAAELGPISVVVNNAGIASRGTLEDYDAAGFERMRRTNVDGVVHTTRAVMHSMRERHYGRVINITSIAGHGTTLPGSTFYAATKAAVGVLTRRFAMELGRSGITVNAIAPGFILTDMVQQGRSEEDFKKLVDGISSRSMLGRIGDPVDIANAVSFLASPESGFITAQILTVDGGRMDYIGHS